MIEKLKICMIGGTAVGKSSLVNRYMNSIFEERYETTIGVKIQARRLQRGDRTLDLVLWDLSGEDEFQSVQPSYVRGAAGYLLVIDGTRRETFDTAIALQKRIRATIGDAAFVVVLNKIDLAARWDLAAEATAALARRGWVVVRTSAKTGEGVDVAFERLVSAIDERRRAQPWV
jgi:small GTP-binding protein